MYDYEISIDKYNRWVSEIEKKINEESKLAEMYFKTAETLKSYQGKVINVRIEKAFKLTGYTARYSKYYDCPYLTVYKEVEENGEKVRREHYTIYLAGKSKDQQKLNIEYLKNKGTEYKNNVIKDRKESENLCETVNKYNSALQWFNKAKEDLKKIPHYYEIDKSYY